MSVDGSDRQSRPASTSALAEAARRIAITRREREVLATYLRANDQGHEWVGDSRLPKGRFRIDAPPYPEVNAASLRRLNTLGLVEWKDGTDGPGRVTPLGQEVLLCCPVCGASGPTTLCATATGRDHAARMRQEIARVR